MIRVKSAAPEFAMAHSSEKDEAPKAGAASGWPFLLISAACLPISMWYQHSMAGNLQTQVAAYTLADLQQQSEDDHILLAVWGRVFDVSAGKEFYGKGQSYAIFAGHDCTKAFALTRRHEGLLDQGLEDLTEKQLRHLNRTYWETYVAKYPVVGRLEDPPYQAADYDQFAGPFAEVQYTRPRKASAAATKESVRESRCPVTRAARAVGNALVKLLPRQLLPN